MWRHRRLVRQRQRVHRFKEVQVHLLTLSLVVCVAGLILYLLTLPPKVTRIGELMFFAGLLALLLTIGSKPLV